MKPNPAFLRNLLNAFRDFPEPYMNIRDLESLGFSHEDPELYFHLRLLNDDGFLVRDNGEYGIGTDRSLDGMTFWAAVPLRLTSSGHTFADAMDNDAGFQAVKKSLIHTGASIMRDVAVAALKGELKKIGLLP